MLGSVLNDDDTILGGDNHGFQIMGLINAFKTGDVQTDMLIALIVPLVLKVIFDRLGRIEKVLGQKWKAWISAYFSKPKSEIYERFISYSTTRDCWGHTTNVDEDTKNSVLLKAIKLYVNEVVRLKLKTAHVDLMEIKDRQSSSYYDDEDDDDQNDHGFEDEDDSYLLMTRSRKTMAGMLSRYKVIKSLRSNELHDLGEYGRSNNKGHVWLSIERDTKESDNQNNESGSGKSKLNGIKSIVFHFRSPQEDAIDDFIRTCYRWYVQELAKQEDNSRHLYEMKVSDHKIGSRNSDDGEDGKAGGGIRYKKHKLSDRKTFDSLFFREKQELLTLIDNFRSKSGIYAIPGYPHKLGLLLHGPPGTGKTSLIKALAQYTGRSIVNVPLSRVETNSELASIFFDHQYNVEGQYVPINLSFNDVIFVCEDVDCCSKIVSRRDGKTAADLAKEGTTGSALALPDPKSLFQLFLESSSEDCKTAVETLVSKSASLKTEAERQKPQVLKRIAQRLTRVPALGMMDETIENSDCGRVCQEALDLAEKQKDQYSKLDEILSVHAKTICEMIDADCPVDDEFIREMLGERARLSYPSIPKPFPHQDPGQSSSYRQDITTDSADFSFKTMCPGGSRANDEEAKYTKSCAIGPSLLKKLNPDALSLAGLLNVLDGVVDTPGRILIMTSNHPELLDPALIRPGRIDKQLLLGFMRAPDIISLLELYFQTKLTREQETRVYECVGDDQDKNNGLRATPAQIEQLAAENEQIEDMLEALEKMHPSYVDIE
eukprot:CAMPEP_0113495692 /NCGR_PEP_ID=MMETSP0014_2-20120614/29739_1 /TAXON_ID=2857 /ORGANISM="Nitzschia sp." /LENGTH=771 /DNA_ID=CAMNT_0000389595 /DNA_START=60 /DNA_END=2375 /DNA_ORIENTATION=- /assembly_acc=CAM_ASM_000159